MDNGLSHIENWIFDLDNTLYPPECALLSQVEVKMRGFVGDLLGLGEGEAHKIQKGYFRDHGTTLAGLMANHDIDPITFLDAVHDIDIEGLSVAPKLFDSISALRGRKIIFTNADIRYAERVIDGLGLGGVFDAICDIHQMTYIPKPQASAYHALIAQTGIDPERSLFVEDMARNLAPAKAIGMTTIWINNGTEYGGADDDASFIDLEIPNLADWLTTPYLLERTA